MRPITLSVLTLLCAFRMQAQIASYSFDNKLTETTAGFDAIYIENGSASSNSPIFISNATGQQILLDRTQGLQLPKEINSLIDINSSLELQMTFTLTDIGEGSGRMQIFGPQEGDNDGGFAIFSRHDIFDQNPNYEIVFIYADGGFNQGVPDHPGHEEVPIGVFKQGDIVNINLVLDFANKQWSALVNQTYTTASFNEAYDLELIKDATLQKTFNISWAKGQELSLIEDPFNFTSTAAIDDLALYSPRRPGNTSVLTNALQAMTSHIIGASPLTFDQRSGYLKDIQLNFQGNFDLAIIDINNYLAAYEAANEPLFANRQQVAFSTLSPEAQIVILLQQYIYDYQFTPENITKMQGVAFEAADVFPGFVTNDAPRVVGAVVEINGSYSIIPGARVAGDTYPVKRPTGYYVPAGELVSITIPANLVDKGLVAMIGAHDTDLSARSIANRFVRISKEFPLDKVLTQVANPFGGGLYIRALEGSDIGWFEITIDGAVKSPYFSYRTNRETNPIEWENELSKKHVPWVDLESDNYMMTLPLHHVKDLANPTSLLQQWNDIMDGFNYVGGRPSPRARAEYFLVDSRLPADAFGTGYPQVIGDENAPYSDLGSAAFLPTQILQPEFYKSPINVTFHEMGHGAYHPTLGTEVETVIHNNAVYIYNQLYDAPLEVAFQHSSSELFTLDEAAIDWLISPNFKNNDPMGCDPTMEFYLCDELRYQHRGWAKYIDMVNLFGWSSVHGMNKIFYEDAKENTLENQLRVVPDEVIRAASIANGVNMAPLMHFWGLIPSPELQEELFSLPESNKILERLIHYRDLTPRTAVEFQPWYENNLPKKDIVHKPRYDATLEKFDINQCGQAIITQIDYLIATYFPKLSKTKNIESQNTSISIFPNPSNDIITIDNNSNNTISIVVYNVAGSKIFAQNNITQPKFEFQLDGLPGIYLMEVISEDSTQRFKLIKN